MKTITDPKYPQYEIIPHLIRGWGTPLKRYCVRYRGVLAISISHLTLRQAQRFIVQHAAQDVLQPIEGSVKLEGE